MTMTDTQPATTPDEVRISIMGSDTVTVTLEGPGTVADVIALAAEKLGVELNPERVALVKDGQQVNPDEPVTGGETVTAAPRVANG